MKKLAYEGDATSHGGKILTGSDRIKVSGRRATRIGDKVSARRIINGLDQADTIAGFATRFKSILETLKC